MGNTCFLNASVVQILTCPIFQPIFDRMLAVLRLPHEALDPSCFSAWQCCKALRDILESGRQNLFTPVSLVNHIWSVPGNCPSDDELVARFPQYTQQDACEVQEYIYECIDIFLQHGEIAHGIVTTASGAVIDTSSLCDMKYLTVKKCLGYPCAYERTDCLPSHGVLLPLPAPIGDTEVTLDHLLRRHEVDRFNYMATCERCGSLHLHMKCSFMTAHPPVLRIQLQRFYRDSESGVLQKNNIPVTIPDKVDVNAWLNGAQLATAVSYTVSSALCHAGASMETGHYVCWTKGERGWYLHDDVRVCTTKCLLPHTNITFL